jgi:hypothetical protein
MVMWLRIGGALLITLAGMAALEYLGVGSLLGGRSAEEAQREAHARAGELFWLLIFTVVMATAFFTAMRRWLGHLKRAVVPARHPRGRRVA